MAGACPRVGAWQWLRLGRSLHMVMLPSWSGSLSPTPSSSQLPIFPLLPKLDPAWHPLLVRLDNSIAELGAVLGDGQPVVLAEEGQQQGNQDGFFLENHVLEFLDEVLVSGQDLGHGGVLILVNQPFQRSLSQAK